MFDLDTLVKYLGKFLNTLWHSVPFFATTLKPHEVA